MSSHDEPELLPQLVRELDRQPLSVVFDYVLTRMKIRDGQLQINARRGRYERANLVLPIDHRLR